MLQNRTGGLNGLAVFLIATPVLLWLSGRGCLAVRSDEVEGREVIARDDGTLLISTVACASVRDLMHALRLGGALFRWKRLSGRTRAILKEEAERIRATNARARFFGYTDEEAIVTHIMTGAPASSAEAQRVMDAFKMPEVLRWGVPIGPVFMVAVLPVQLVISAVWSFHS